MSALIMGIVNVTPDSFSDGGRYLAADDAIAHGLQLRAEGAHLLDVGGESTRPGAHRVPVHIEQERVLPVVRALAEAGALVSVDTMNASTALAAVEAGARIVNDVSGGMADPEMLDAVAGTSADIVLSHWRGPSADMYAKAQYADVVAEVIAELGERVEAAAAAGIPPARVIIDPGIGFGKIGEQNWATLRALPRIGGLGHRVVVGTSRKRFLTGTLGADAAADVTTERRDFATAVTSVLAAQAGVWAVRVHDVTATRDALLVAESWEGGEPMDEIALTGLRVFGHHGVYEEERRAGQYFVVDFALQLDTRRAARTDDVAETVHYGEAAERIAEIVSGEPVNLLETLAARIAGALLEFPSVERARVTVHKPDAPIPLPFADVAVTVDRARTPS